MDNLNLYFANSFIISLYNLQIDILFWHWLLAKLSSNHFIQRTEILEKNRLNRLINMKSYHLNELIYVTIFPLKINLFFFVVTFIRLLFLAIFLSTERFWYLNTTWRNKHTEVESFGKRKCFATHAICLLFFA